jgi:hypothetical protein
MTKSRQLGSEEGWVMVPVIVLMVVAMAVAFALLAIVDTQTGQSREQRSKDSAQTLAEGAISSTANVLADSASGLVWKITACESVTGNLVSPSTAPSTSFAAKLTKEIQDRFAGTSPDYTPSASQKTAWRVDVCPVQSTDARWSDSFLTRAAVPAAGGSAPASLWVRGQATVRARAAATNAENTRTVASKVRQSSTPYPVPKDFAVGTGAFSTDVGLATNTATSSLLAGRIVKPLIADQNSKMGVRCGLLNTLNNLSSTCVTGALAGVGGTTNALGLGVLNTALGVDRAQMLNTWSMAPKDAIDAWLAEAKASNTYTAQVAGVGDVRTKTVPATVTGGADCFSGSPTASQVIFIDQVGNGEQYCNVRADATAKILVVRRGGVRVSAHFTGVVYALNQQECTNADGTCSTANRTNAVPREVVRIDGNTGYVTGSVWADGAGGSVGIYPSLNLTGTGPNASLLAVGGANGICSLPVLGTVLNTLGTTLAGLTSVVGKVLPLVTGVQEEVRYPNGGSAPTGCSLLTGQLGGLTTSQLLNVFGSGGTTNVVLSEHRTQTCKTWLLLVCTAWNAPGPWTPRDTASVTVPALLSTGTPSVIEQVAGVLGATLNNYTAITYDATVVNNASAQIAQGAGPVVGTFRNLEAAS